MRAGGLKEGGDAVARCTNKLLFAPPEDVTYGAIRIMTSSDHAVLFIMTVVCQLILF